MFTDVRHNKIVGATVTPRFMDCLKEELLPVLVQRYGDGLLGICMYEEYLDSAMTVEGRYYYPLTVVAHEPSRVFISWDVSRGKLFERGIPYAYIGEEPLGIAVCDSVPRGVAEVAEGRPLYYSEGSMKVGVHAESADPLFLCGRYSQSFVDELSRQITAEISRLMSVEGIEDSDIELSLVFASGTYMEHTSENLTYRRMLLSDKYCQARDLWVKWTRLDGATGFSVTDTVTAETVKFELGEDVPQKIREKEFRFLCKVDPDKYQSAMGKKTATEWRDIIKRAVKRGDIRKVSVIREDASTPEDDKAMSALLNSFGLSPIPEEAKAPMPKPRDDELLRLAREALGDYEPADREDAPSPEQIPEEQTVEEEAAEERKLSELREAEMAAEMERIRREIEGKLRLEYEERERQAALRHAEEEQRIRAEAQKQAQQAIDAQRAEIEQAKLIVEENRRIREESQALRDRIALNDQRELKERELIAQAARIAVEEQKRIEAEKLVIAEQKRIAEEQRQQALEQERIRAEVEAERERIINQGARNADAASRPQPAEQNAKPTPVSSQPSVQSTEYIEKTARIQFRYDLVNPGVINKIKDIVEQTLISQGKQEVRIFMKAYPLDQSVVVLDVKLPREEQSLLITLIKAIGNGGLGVTKITLE